MKENNFNNEMLIYIFIVCILRFINPVFLFFQIHVLRCIHPLCYLIHVSDLSINLIRNNNNNKNRKRRNKVFIIIIFQIKILFVFNNLIYNVKLSQIRNVDFVAKF